MFQQHQAKYAKYMQHEESWQIGFQERAAPTHEGKTELHKAIVFYLVDIVVKYAICV